MTSSMHCSPMADMILMPDMASLSKEGIQRSANWVNSSGVKMKARSATMWLASRVTLEKKTKSHTKKE